MNIEKRKDAIVSKVSAIKCLFSNVFRLLRAQTREKVHKQSGRRGLKSSKRCSDSDEPVSTGRSARLSLGPFVIHSTGLVSFVVYLNNEYAMPKFDHAVLEILLNLAWKTPVRILSTGLRIVESRRHVKQ